MTARIVLAEGALGSVQRAAINDNFTELFDPDYLVACRSTSQSIPTGTTSYPGTWTGVIFDAPYSNTTGVTMNTSTGVMTFPLGGSDDCFGTWMLSGIVAWDNTLAGLQTHVRKIRIKATIGGFPFVLATADQLFDSAQGTSGELAYSYQQVYSQVLIDPSLLTCTVAVEVWHNAKVAGVGTAINVMPNGIQAPLVIGARLSNYS